MKKKIANSQDLEKMNIYSSNIYSFKYMFEKSDSIFFMQNLYF